MKSSKSLLLFFILIIISSAFVKRDKWVSFQSKELGFKIEFPKLPEQSSQEVDSEIGKLKINQFLYDATSNPKSDNLIYQIDCTEYPKGSISSEDTITLSKFYKDAVKGAVSKVKGKLISEKTILLQSYEGREIKIDYQEGLVIITTQMFLVKNRMYTLQTICNKGNDNNKSIDRFMKSFKLID